MLYYNIILQGQIFIFGKHKHCESYWYAHYQYVCDLPKNK